MPVKKKVPVKRQRRQPPRSAVVSEQNAPRIISVAELEALGINNPYQLQSAAERHGERSGGPTSYYLVNVTRPNQGVAPYMAECGDIIEALGMTFNEGCAFKAIWRSAAARSLGLVKDGHDPIYDAEKVQFYGKRMEVMAKPE